MSKFDEALVKYGEQLKSHSKSAVDANLLRAVTKSLGPSIYREDASKVSCSDPEELKRIKERFLKGKLGLAESPALDAALKDVCETMGSSNRNKYRAVFYYHLVVKFGKQSMFA